MHYIDEAVKETDTYIRRAGKENKNLILIRLEIATILQHLFSRVDAAEPFRIRKDVMGLISSMLHGTGKLIYSSHDYCILLIESRSLSHGTLLLHQVHKALGNLFSLDDKPLPELSFQERLFPRDGDSAEELLENFL